MAMEKNDPICMNFFIVARGRMLCQKNISRQANFLKKIYGWKRGSPSIYRGLDLHTSCKLQGR